MPLASTFGFLGATLTTASFVPQVMKTWKYRQTKDISLLMYTLFAIGVFAWTIYGILLRETPLIIANGITFVFALVVLTLKIKHG